MSEAHHLDTNVILRFLLADDPKQSLKARAWFALAQAGKVTLCISHVCLAEVTWVLLSFYAFKRGKLATTLRELVLHDGVEVENVAVLLDAFDRFGRVNVDFIDCYAAALAKHTGCPMVTEDRNFKKFTDLVSRRPAEVLHRFTS
jgi:predicted nucleic acid-binding protein